MHGLTLAGFLTDLYYDSIDARKSAILSADAATCAWIWNTNFIDWLRADAPTSNVFWICGKPGSGKSTLIKYLSSCRELRLQLPQEDWTMINFFFDFRLKDGIGNTFEGLLRSLVIQVIEQLPDLPLALRATTKPAQMSIPALKEIFEKILRTPGLLLFIIVDGLDEYSGNMRLLLDFFLLCSNRANVRLCLASRPHAIIETMLSSQSLQMSEHNSDGIRKYIDLAVKTFEADFSQKRWKVIRKNIEKRAEGVILWVCLVIEEVLQAISAGDTMEEIQLLLDEIPDALDALYQRILDNIPSKRATEAAIIYWLISAVERPLNVALLHSMIAFIRYECCHDLQIVGSDDERTFERRLRSTLGALLHLQRQDQTYSESNIGLLADRVNKSLMEYGTSVTNVRVMHKTVTSYMLRSGWARERLPSSFTDSFPDHVLERLAAKALVVGDARAGNRLEEILAKLHGNFASLKSFQILIQEVTSDDVFAQWASLLHFSIVDIIPRCLLLLTSSANASIISFVEAMLRSRLSTLHFAMSWHHYRVRNRPLSKYLGPDVGDFMVAAEHGLSKYLDVHEDRIRHLKDYERDAILVQLMSAVEVYRESCLDLRQDAADEPWAYNAIHSTVDMVLSHQKNINSFHIALRLLLRHLVSSNSLLMRKTVPFDTRVRLPEWNQSLRNTLIGRDLLFIWACEYELCFARDSEKGSDFGTDLETLLSLGVNINKCNKAGMNVVHHLISTHLIGHFFRCWKEGPSERFSDKNGCFGSYDPWTVRPDYVAILNVFEKLYLVEEHGADFTGVGEHGSPLRVFARSRGRLLQAIQSKTWYMMQQEDLSPQSKEIEMTMKTLDELSFMLAHKETYGHLPRPMVNEYDLQHYHCRPRKPCKVCIDGNADFIQENSPGDFESHECLEDDECFDESGWYDDGNAEIDNEEPEEEQQQHEEFNGGKSKYIATLEINHDSETQPMDVDIRSTQVQEFGEGEKRRADRPLEHAYSSKRRKR